MQYRKWERGCYYMWLAGLATAFSWPALAGEPDIKTLPVVPDISMVGDFASMGTAGAKATAIYTYSDFDSDPEQGSLFEWFVVPNEGPELNCINNPRCIRVAQPTFGTAESYPVLALGPDVAGTQIDWSLTPFDEWADLKGLLLSFCVTPRNERESGLPRCTLSQRPLSDIDSGHQPYAYQLAVSPSAGITIDSVLSGSYLFGDDLSHAENGSLFRWKNEREYVVAEGISGGSALGVTVDLSTLPTPAEVIGHRLRFCIIPRDDKGVEGSMACSVPTDLIGGSGNQPPELLNLNVSGDMVMGRTVSARYQYQDAESNLENTSAELASLRWEYRATSSAPWQSLSVGAGLSVTVANSVGQMRFCMTPYATEGTLVGSEACSPARTIMSVLPAELPRLRARYDSLAVNCGSSSAPAFLCSGLLVRGGEQGRYSWDITGSDAVSFNYLRRDANFSGMARGEAHGMIFLPIIGTRDLANKPNPDELEIYCAFPIQADTAQRSENGCGQHASVGPESDYCDRQFIDNLGEWSDHFYGVTEDRRRAHQCGFDVHDNENKGTAERFMLSLKARESVERDYFNEPNELKIESWFSWPIGDIPIEAFFYSDASGLADAQQDQRYYHSMTGNWVPLLAITLPDNSGSLAEIHYYADEQAIPN